MSIRVIKLILENYREGDSASKLCLVALAWFANDEGRNIFPSLATIARYLGVSERHARRVLSQLVKSGDLLVVGNAKGGNHGATRRYEISADLLCNKDIHTGDTHVPRQPNMTGDSRVRDGGHGGPGRGTPASATGDTYVPQAFDLQPLKNLDETHKQQAASDEAAACWEGGKKRREAQGKVNGYTHDFMLYIRTMPIRRGDENEEARISNAWAPWNRMVKKHGVPEIIQGAKRYRAYCEARDLPGNLIKNAANFLWSSAFLSSWDIPLDADLPDWARDDKQADKLAARLQISTAYVQNYAELRAKIRSQLRKGQES